MKPKDGDGDFERWLEAELKRALGPASGPSPRAVQAGYHAVPRRGGLLMNRVAILTAKGLAVFAAAAFAGGAVVVTTTTGSANPVVWGRQLKGILSDQVLTNEHDTGPRPSADPSASAGQQQIEERRSSNSPGSAPATSRPSHATAGSHTDGSHNGSHKNTCDARNERHRPAPSPRH